MTRVLWTLLALVLGVALGLGLTALALNTPPDIGLATSGPWKAHTRLGSNESDPYTRAALVQRGELPMGAAEGLELFATADQSGAPLRGACRYRLSGHMPAANYWTLTVYSRHGEAPQGRNAITSSEVVYGEKGDLTLVLAADVQPGNWLALSGGSSFELVLRLYETQVSTSAPMFDRITLPVLTREDCR